MFKHWRIIRTDTGRFQGGEWADPGHAYRWAEGKEEGFRNGRIKGPYVIVETDVYGSVKTAVQLEFGWN